MPCILKVRIVAARNLPIMDRATELADAFVEVKFADFDTHRTRIERRTLNPVWNEDFRFEVSDDADLQNEPLEIKVMDYDQITYNDSIGNVMIDLNSLLSWDSQHQTIAGWFPIFDTLRGIRGELMIQVRLQFFGDINPFKDSSAGVQFFTIKRTPPTYEVLAVLGFVGALDTGDDPEYHWSDNFRAPRTSNESRTRIMFRLSGQLLRQVGKRVLEMGGNAVIGYKQYFDLEAESRNIIARAVGTAVRLGHPDQHRIIDINTNNNNVDDNGGAGGTARDYEEDAFENDYDDDNVGVGSGIRYNNRRVRSEMVPLQSEDYNNNINNEPSSSAGDSNILNSPTGLGPSSPLVDTSRSQPQHHHHQVSMLPPSSSPGSLSNKFSAAAAAASGGSGVTTPAAFGNASTNALAHMSSSSEGDLATSPTGSISLGVSAMAAASQQQQIFKSLVGAGEQQIFTIDCFPSRSIIGTGGFVSAASVKMIEDDGAKDVREAWWSELRDEVKAHSKALGCQYVLGYSEHISIEEELVVLHCTGTACNLDLSAFGSNSVFATDVAAVSGGGVVGGGDGTGLITNGDVGYDDEFDASEPSGGGGGDVTANSMATGDLILGSLPPVSPASPSRRRGNSHAAAKNISLIMDDNDNTSKSINNPAATKPPSSAAAAAAVASPSSPRSVGVQPLITKYPTLKYRQSAATMPHSTSDGADVGGQMYDEPNSMALVTSSRSGPRMSKRRKRKMQLTCHSCHITYKRKESPFPMAFARCGCCKKRFVPEMILSTIEPPPELQTIGRGVLLEAHVCRQKKAKIGESNATVVSESIPFAQYDIHRQLMYKLRIYGLNAVFGLKIQMSIGETLMTAVATGTAVFVKALPAPPSLKVFRNLEVLDDEDKRLMEIQRTIMFQSEQNRRQIELALEKKEEAAVSLNNSSSSANHNTLPSPVAVTNSGINPCSIPPATATASSNQEPSGINNNSSESSSSQSAHPLAIATGSVPNEGGVVKSASKFMSTSDGDDESSDSSRSDSDSEDEQMGRTYGNVNNSGGSNNNTNNRRPTNVVQIDDEQDEDLVLLLDPTFPEGFQRCNTEFIPRSATLLQGRNSRGGPCHSQMITLVKQGLINSVSHHPNRQLANIFKSMYQEMQFQLSYFSPCLVAGIEYSVQLPKDNEVQIQLTAVALGQFMDLGSSSSSNYDGDTYSEEEREIASAFAAMDEPPTVASSVLGGGSLVSGFSGLKFNMGKSLLSQGRQATKISVQSIPDEPQQQQPPQQQQQQDEAAAEAEDVVFPMDEEDDKDDLLAARKGGAARGSNATGAGTEEFGVSGAGDSTTFGGGKSLSDHFYKPVEITPLSYIPQVKIDRFLGRLSLHFVKEANIVFEAGLGQYGMGGFSHTFVTELYSILRAHTVALGGNGLIGVTIDQSVFSESIKNQGYALISASGDVVQYSQIKEANRYQHASGSFDSLQK